MSILIGICLLVAGYGDGDPSAVAQQSPPQASTEIAAFDASSDTTTPDGVSLLPIAASVVPGFLLHGAGAYAAGETTTAKRLLLIEGVGLGLAASGLAGLALTGASRRFVTPLISMTVVGGFGFVGSFLADTYGVSTPMQSRGAPPLHAPRLEATLLTSYRYDPRAATDAVMSPAARVSFGDLSVGALAQFAPSNATTRLRGDVRYRALAGRSFVDLQLAVTQLSLGDDDVATTSIELVVPARLDLALIGRSLRGGFAELALGGLIASVGYDRVDARDTDSALLARATLGAYLGDGDGDVTLYYDHRRDTLTGGLLGGGIAAGFLGFVGTSATWFPTRNVGATATVEIGSALVAGLGLALRFGADQ